MRMNLAAIVLSGLAFFACSSTASHPDGAAGAGGTENGSGGNGGVGGSTADAGHADAGDAGNACAGAVEQGACTAEGTICNIGGTDVCQFGNSLRCTGGHWQHQESAPAPCFACGPTLHCQINNQFCYTVVGGAVGNPPSYQCKTTPAACLPHPTCTCLRDQNMAATICSDGGGDAGAGQITATLEAP